MTASMQGKGFGSIGRMAAKGALAALMAVTVSGVAQACLSTSVPAHTLALSVRTLQSDLMVSALSCNDRADYNTFATKYRPQLRTHGDVLTKYFNQVYGGKANRELNTYVTDLANFAAVRHATNAGDFCGGADSAFGALLIDEKNIKAVALAYSIQVSPTLKQEIAKAATTNGCEVTTQGNTVVANGVTILE